MVHYTDKAKIEAEILKKFPRKKKPPKASKPATNGGQVVAEEDIAVAEQYMVDGDFERQKPKVKKQKLKTSEE